MRESSLSKAGEEIALTKLCVLILQHASKLPIGLTRKENLLDLSRTVIPH